MNTRSHPELGRENPQRQWYCVLRRGRVGRRQVFTTQEQQTAREKKRIPTHNHDPLTHPHAGWSSPVARQAHNLKVVGSNPTPATMVKPLILRTDQGLLLFAVVSFPTARGGARR